MTHPTASARTERTDAPDDRPPAEKLTSAILRLNETQAALYDPAVPRGEAEAARDRAASGVRFSVKELARALVDAGVYRSLTGFYEAVVTEANGLQGSRVSVGSPMTVRNAIQEPGRSVHLVQLAAQLALREAWALSGVDVEALGADPLAAGEQ